MVAYSVVGFVAEVEKTPGPVRLLLLAVLVVVECVAVWINVGVLARRWHDRGKSGWMSLILLVPIVGVIWLYVELGGLRGTIGSNRFGADPLDSLGRLQAA